MEYKSTSLSPKKADLIIVFLAAVMALSIILFFARNGDGKTAVILKDGREITRIDLNNPEKREITVTATPSL